MSESITVRSRNWQGRLRRPLVALATVVAVLGPLAASAEARPLPAAGSVGAVELVVRPSGPVTDARAAVERLGGTVTRPLGILAGFTASLPADRVAALRRVAGIGTVTEDVPLRLLGDHWRPDRDLGSYAMTTASVGAPAVWSRKDARGATITGKGVGVALIDSGVVPVDGLKTPGKVINGPDLSFESQAPNLRHLDTFGHGTHMAGIIAGRDAAVRPGLEADPNYFVGLAPDATLLSLKVAASDGAVDVSQVIAAIDWVVQHRDDPGLNIRVLNLSFGTDSTQSYQLDPLAFAVEVAWRRGIVVVVSAGNEGAAGTTLNMPAVDPYVLAVGASDHNGTESGGDDSVATFSSVGDATRRPDLLAPGRSLVSLRAPGSFIDTAYPAARVTANRDERFFRGSGTSQATAVVAGAAALLLQERPGLTPDQVKYLLTANARRLAGASPAQGAGVLNLAGIERVALPANVAQTHPLAVGTGWLEDSRGGSHVADPLTGGELVGEQDIFGDRWVGRTWATDALAGRTWSGGDWRGRTWSGDAWSGSSWAGRTWSGVSWSGRTWSGRTWSGRTWSGNVWDGRTWSGTTWSGRTWSGRTWSGDAWS